MLFDSIPVPDEQARVIADAVRHLDNEYRALRHRVVADAGLSTAELDVLASIADAPTMTPKRLAAAANLTTSAMTALLDRLAASGLVRRRPHPTDRRSLVVVLTPAGERLISELYRRYVSRFEGLMTEEAFSAADTDRLVALLGRLTATLAASDGRSTLAASA